MATAYLVANWTLSAYPMRCNNTGFNDQSRKNVTAKRAPTRSPSGLVLVGQQYVKGPSALFRTPGLYVRNSM